MRPQIRLWSIKAGKLVEMPKSIFAEAHKEKDLEDWVEQNSSLLGRSLSVLGRQINIPKVGQLDLLAVDGDGRLVIVEFKRQQSTRDAIAQILDYASSLQRMSLEQLRGLANFDGTEIGQVTDLDPAMILVAAEADESAERIVEYLASKSQLLIEIVTFTYATLDDGREILARSLLIPEPTASTTNKASPKITREELFSIAESRGVLSYVEKLHQFTKMGWTVEMFRTSGGKIRYWVKLPTGGWRVLFGVYVEGEIFNSPKGELDVWVRPEAVAEFNGMISDDIIKQIRQFKIKHETPSAITVCLSDEVTASKLYDVLQGWISMSTTLLSAN